MGRGDCSTTAWTEIEPEPQGSLFVRGDRAVEREFERGLSLPEIFPVHGTGIVTGRDSIVTALDRDTLRARFGADLEPKITVFLARPFDLRSVLYAEGYLERPRRALMSHLLSGANLGLIACRQCKGEPGALVTRWLVGHKALCPHDVSSLFPLYLDHGAARRPNLAPGLRERLGGWYGAEPEPEAVLGYVYAVLSSEAYRQRYRELLRRSFPRISFPPDSRQFAALSALGRELIGLHLLQDSRLRQATVRAGEGSAACEGVEPEIWEYRIGGYRVLRQWLWARRGRGLSAAEARHFCRIVEALRLTRDVQRRIQEVMCD